MIFIGLLTHQQKQAGYFITQDEDFVWLWQGRNTDRPRLVKCWLYERLTIKEVRDTAEECKRELESNVTDNPLPLEMPRMGVKVD